MTTNSINTADAKDAFTELMNRVSHNKERIVLTRRGKEIAAIIPIEDLHQLEASQNKHDLRDAADALKEARIDGAITLDALKEELDT